MSNSWSAAQWQQGPSQQEGYEEVSALLLTRPVLCFISWLFLFMVQDVHIAVKPNQRPQFPMVHVHTTSVHLLTMPLDSLSYSVRRCSAVLIDKWVSSPKVEDTYTPYLLHTETWAGTVLCLPALLTLLHPANPKISCPALESPLAQANAPYVSVVHHRSSISWFCKPPIVDIQPHLLNCLIPMDINEDQHKRNHTTCCQGSINADRRHILPLHRTTLKNNRYGHRIMPQLLILVRNHSSPLRQKRHGPPPLGQSGCPSLYGSTPWL